MSQKTGRGPTGQGPRKPQGPDSTWETSDSTPIIDARTLVAQEDDLGLKEEEAFIPDPTGFDPKGPVHNIAGREMIQLSRGDLNTLHHAHAGNQPMIPDPTKHLSDRPLPDPSRFADQMDPQQKIVHEKAQADVLASEVLADFAAPSVEESAPQPEARTTAPQPKPSEPTIVTSDPTEAVQVLEAVIIRAQRARDEGDVRTATELNAIAQRIIEGTNIKRVQPQRERHPTAQRLLEAFGLEKIVQTEIEWNGFKWMFKARPPGLDFWITTHSGANNMDLNAAIIAASVVAIDGEPLWKVLNIPLMATYEVEGEPTILAGIPPETAPVAIPVYRKYCQSCSCEVGIEDEKCATCGATQDPFAVPIELRLKYADSLFRFITEQLGVDFADLQGLVNLYRATMKDRMFDKEELYPLLRLSKTQSEKIPG